MILFSCIYTGFGGINGYLMRQGQTVQAGELFVFGMDSWIPQLIITVAFLILVNDIPFGKSGAQLQLIRSSRSRWLLGQTLSGFSTAAVYLILVELLFVVTTVRNLSFSDEWSQPVILAARLGKCTAIGIETAVRFPMSVLMNKSAWAVFGVAWLYAWLLYGFFCLILIVSNLKFHTNVRYMAGARAYATTAGFESVCEAMYLGKPVLMVPTHIEQACNAFDAVHAGAGVIADRFDLDALLQLSQTHQPDLAFSHWVKQADWLILREFRPDLLMEETPASLWHRLSTRWIYRFGKLLSI